MLSKTKIYIDKESLEIIAQDSTISDYYYKNIIEIFRRHADLYLDLSEDELYSIREPQDLNDPGDIYTFIEGKNLPWPSSASKNFEAIQNRDCLPDITGNIVYILNKKEDVKKLRDKFGVLAIYIDELNDDILYYDYTPDLDMESIPGSAENGWQSVLKDEVHFLPPSNSIVISDSNLLTNTKKNEETGENHFCGLVNLKDLLNMLLPQNIEVPFYILIVCPPNKKLEEGKMNKLVRRWIKEMRNLRQYKIVVEFIITTKTVHSRDLYSNNYQIHLDKGFYVFEPWSKRVHKEGASHNNVRLFTYLFSPFKRGKSDIESAIVDLKLICKMYDAFLRNTGDSKIIDITEDPILPTDFSKNRIIF
jgi:hypothetical protein